MDVNVVTLAVGVKLMLLRRCDCNAVVLAVVTVLNIPEPVMGRKLCCSCAVLDLVIANML